jgi:hypothetical protein
MMEEQASTSETIALILENDNRFQFLNVRIIPIKKGCLAEIMV